MGDPVLSDQEKELITKHEKLVKRQYELVGKSLSNIFETLNFEERVKNGDIAFLEELLKLTTEADYLQFEVRRQLRLLKNRK